MPDYTLIISIATPLATLMGVIWAIYQYAKEATRKKRSETLKIYNELFDDTYEIREAYYKETTELLFTSNKIHSNPELYKKMVLVRKCVGKTILPLNGLFLYLYCYGNNLRLSPSILPPSAA